ncbi:hypothetical protein G6F56_010396 [Rhizopus delemar]|nr:hypothetical protein G6F56_010396 [Rhizopus delemar]
MDIEREDRINGVEIPRQVSEELDNTPTHQLNENFKKFRRETQRYFMGEYREQIRQLAVFGLETAKAQEREAKEYADKALNIPLSIRHLETTEEDNKSKNAYSDEFLSKYHQAKFERKLVQQASVNRRGERGNGFASRGYQRGNRNFGYGGDGELRKTTIQPNTNHHINQTTPPTPNNINDKLQYPNRRCSAREPITTFSQKLTVDHQISMALICDTRWLSDTNQIEQSAMEEAVTKFVQAGIIEVSLTQNINYLSNFFTIQEATKRRPILD